MDWQKQMEQMVSKWTETQRRLFDQWVDSVKGVAPGAESLQQQYHTQIDAWEKAVHDAFERQQQWAQALSGQESSPSVSQEAAEQWAHQAEEAMRVWTETQSRLWENWLGQLRQTEGSDGAMVGNAAEVMKAWQDAAQRAQEMAAQWPGTSGGGTAKQ